MQRLTVSAIALLAVMAATPASADAIDDPLHLLSCTSASNCTNAGDNGSFTPLAGSSFGVAISPGPQTGDLTLVIGVPTDQINPLLFNLPGLTDNSLGISVSAFDRVSFFNVGSPSLSTYLGLAGTFTPTDNFANMSAGTSIFDPGFLGNYLVFTATLSGVTLGGLAGCAISCATTQDFEFGANLPSGSFVAGLFINDAGDHIGTAASAHLVTPFVAVPGPIVGAGLPGLLAVLTGLVGFQWRRRRRQMA